MKYSERLRNYEKEKAKLSKLNLSSDEYQKALIELVKKWKI